MDRGGGEGGGGGRGSGAINDSLSIEREHYSKRRMRGGMLGTKVEFPEVILGTYGLGSIEFWMCNGHRVCEKYFSCGRE